ncbi:uncharacterized protein EI97DRAFT_258619 [Westerdykella ornata]|uniref:Uncharacterized protein n=1 Tax=Westerdykella ornata TaxID=318751 RepID=A0A6A6J5P0_WESOR|nr:uncharacterized protein EI97DRAFT_258619 [Westerdykella ornata]KAF2271755.1 hypothetical protein EI97DRAFT_258619 [Westerdykella ornata]
MMAWITGTRSRSGAIRRHGRIRCCARRCHQLAPEGSPIAIPRSILRILTNQQNIVTHRTNRWLAVRWNTSRSIYRKASSLVNTVACTELVVPLSLRPFPHGLNSAAIPRPAATTVQHLQPSLLHTETSPPRWRPWHRSGHSFASCCMRLDRSPGGGHNQTRSLRTEG